MDDLLSPFPELRKEDITEALISSDDTVFETWQIWGNITVVIRVASPLLVLSERVPAPPALTLPLWELAPCLGMRPFGCGRARLFFLSHQGPFLFCSCVVPTFLAIGGIEGSHRPMLRDLIIFLGL